MPKQGHPFKQLLARDLLALFGAHNLKDPYEIGRMSLSPQKVQVHDDWNPDLESFDADIAIVTFEAGAIMFSTYVQPICLWNGNTPPSQNEGHIGSWGQSENLEKFFEEIPTKLKLPIHTQETCFLTTKDLVDLASNRTFCAGSGDGTGVCHGDNGGGLSIKVDSVFYFRGIVSSGLHDEISCDVSKFAIFTDVLKFKPWIDQIMREDSETLVPEAMSTNLYCTIQLYAWEYLSGAETIMIRTCIIEDQKIDDERLSVADDANQSIQGFNIEGNKEVKFLPENIVESFPKLIAYQVYNCSIRTINAKHFKGLNNLELLFLDYNEVESIDGDAFKDLTKLEELSLHYNKITMIAPNLFQPLTSLEEFRAGNNEIEFLDENIFDNFQNIRSIALHNNKLSTIPANLFKNNLKLEGIFLDENKIKTISSTMFVHLQNLTYVGLRYNFCVNGFYLHNRFNIMKYILWTGCNSPLVDL